MGWGRDREEEAGRRRQLGEAGEAGRASRVSGVGLGRGLVPKGCGAASSFRPSSGLSPRAPLTGPRLCVIEPVARGASVQVRGPSWDPDTKDSLFATAACCSQNPESVPYAS